MAEMPEEMMGTSQPNVALSSEEQRVFDKLVHETRIQGRTAFTQEELGLGMGYAEFETLKDLIKLGLVEEYPTTPGTRRMYKLSDSGNQAGARAHQNWR